MGLSSLEDGAFEDVVVLTVPEGIPADGFVMDLGTEVYARFARIVILEVEEGNELDTPIGVNRLVSHVKAIKVNCNVIWKQWEVISKCTDDVSTHLGSAGLVASQTMFLWT